MDDFGIKHDNQDDLDHLLNTLQKKYEISIDHSGRNYIGLTIYWEYYRVYVDISMPQYIMKALHKFFHIARKQHASHTWMEPEYCEKVHYAFPECTLSLLDNKGAIRIQAINGTFLYY